MTEPQPAPEPRSPLRNWLRAILGLAGVIGILFLARRLPVGEAVDWIRAQGSLAPLLFVLLYVVACAAFVPGSLLTLSAGAIFGPVLGFFVVSAGSTLAAAASFLLGRSVARKAIARRLESYPRFQAIDEAVGKEGWKIVGLLRLSPVFPFSLLNYALGLTRVSFREYVLASWLGMIPGTLLYVYLGSVIGEALLHGNATRPSRSTAEWTLYGVGLLATVAVTFLLTRIARRALQRHLA
jgi:uncharacterized membrane protein YdjX (TVP38/TMEM64 family)